MSEQWVVNASPLILLARIGREDLLRILPERVAIPRAVVSEINAGPLDDPARRVLAEASSRLSTRPRPQRKCSPGI